MNLEYLKQLDKLVAEGLLRKAVSADGKLAQYNYTDLCNNTAQWNEYTLENRGNVYELSTGKLVCKCFPKFFNFEQLPEEQQQGLLARTDFSVTIKYDGCL